jgi:hypothetical protein
MPGRIPSSTSTWKPLQIPITGRPRDTCSSSAPRRDVLSFAASMAPALTLSP